MAVILPKGREAWPEEHPGFRVEYMDRVNGSVDRESGSLLRKVYFDGGAEALSFAEMHTTWGGLPCDVESRDMPVTHEVRSEALNTKYTLSIKRFGNVESARAEFVRAMEHAKMHGGKYVLAQVGVTAPLEVFSHSVD